MKSRASAVLHFTRCFCCGGSWLSNIRHRQFSDYKAEDKSTHFGYERISEEEKTRKGKPTTKPSCFKIYLSLFLMDFIKFTVFFSIRSKT